MDTFSIAIIVGLAISLLGGYLLGFGRTLRFFTKGIVGLAFSIFFCVMFGGVIANISFIADAIQRGNDYFAQFANILNYIPVGTIIYYIILFFICQILRIVIVKAIAALFQPGDKGSRVYKIRSLINRILGTILFGAIFILFVYLIMAVIALVSDVKSVNTFLTELKDSGKSLFYLMYSHNPIDLTKLIKTATETAEELQDAIPEGARILL